MSENNDIKAELCSLVENVNNLIEMRKTMLELQEMLTKIKVKIDEDRIKFDLNQICANDDCYHPAFKHEMNTGSCTDKNCKCMNFEEVELSDLEEEIENKKFKNEEN
jgi:hypothetical protein